jgi:hypothetical protein
VDACTTVDVGRILAGQDPDAHPGRVAAGPVSRFATAACVSP